MPAIVALIVFLVVVVAAAQWIDNHPPAAQLLVLSGYVATAIFIYRKFSNSRWLRSYNQTVATDRQKREEEKAERTRLAEWAAYHMPTGQEMYQELIAPFGGFAKMLNSNRAADVSGQYEINLEAFRVGDVQHAQAHYANLKTRFTPIAFNENTRFAGTWIVAPSGRGKTNLLHNLIAEDRTKPCTIVLMDSKGDLINGYRGYADAVVIDPKTANINPLQLGSSTRSVEFLEYIFSALLETGMTALQKTLFRSVLTVLIKVPNATLETFRQILTGGWRQLDLEPYILQCDPATVDFFLAGKPAEFDSATYKETKQQILWRLRLILSNDYLRAIFTSPTTNVPFSQLLDSGKTIIIDNSKDDLGEEGAEFFGRFFVALIWMAAVSRSRMRPEDKVPVYVYIDECQSVIKRDEKIATILDECRSQKIALVLAHQRIAQIQSPNVLDALGNCAIRLANSDDDAAQLAPRFRVDPPALRVPVGQFACFVRDTTRQAVTIYVPHFDTNIFPSPPSRSHPEPAPRTPQPPTVRPQPRAVPTDEVEDF